MIYIKIKISFLLVFIVLQTFGQMNPGYDSVVTTLRPFSEIGLRHPFQAPSILLASGASFAIISPLHTIEKNIQHSFIRNGVKSTSIDDKLQYTPALAYYSLDLFGVKGKHNFKQKFKIHLASEIVATGLVTPMKHIIHRQRPDGSDFKSFPSGHTTTAFVGAELLRMEYGQRSPWIAVAGYTAASATAYLRMQNNAHWFGDVLAGAGMGILSARLGYWIYRQIGKEAKRQSVTF